MVQAMVTIVCPLDRSRVGDIEKAIDALGNPARPDLEAALKKLDEQTGGGTHFASLHALTSYDGERGYIMLEFSADGEDSAALARLVEAAGTAIRPIFAQAADWADGADLTGYLSRHRVAVGGGWFDNPGLAFSGTPGMTVGRIGFEATLAARVNTLLAEQLASQSALARIDAIRARLRREGTFLAALTPADESDTRSEPSALSLDTGLALSFVRTYLWPLVIAVLAWGVVAGIRAAWDTSAGWPGIRAFAFGAISGIWTGAWLALLLVIVLAATIFALFRKAEAEDSLDDRSPDPAINAAMYARENQALQNHMVSVTQRKPGAIRNLTSRLIFWIIGELATRSFRPGFLGNIGSIHFARWVTPPGSPDVLFFSNYDGSWESYLEDFITRAHNGLTGVWSNSIGFPRSENLVGKGATDGERFKRYARRSMVPTRFWFSAYPKLTTRAIRANAEIRRGLSGVMTEDEAVRWLSLFGSAYRPPSKLVSSEIQSLVFGGLGFMPFGTCLILDLPASDHAAARKWLAEISPSIAFNDGRRLRRPAVATLAFGARGLARLGLPKSAIATFPFAFQEGMAGSGRARILGDVGDNGPANWRWGQTQPDVVLLVYGATRRAVGVLRTKLTALAAEHGLRLSHTIPLDEVYPGKAEPFGFADGVSQPVIRGTYKGLRNADPIHLVEPGEFILGYPDNRGNVPPGPTLPAVADPDNLLPLVAGGTGFDQTQVEHARDVGFNGSFLVIRDLEQDVDGFWAYCREESARLADCGRLPEPYPLAHPDSDADRALAAEFIGAKMIGRWKDGSSLARYPYEPKSVMDARSKAAKAAVAAARAAALGKKAATRAVAADTGADTGRMVRGRTNPGGKEPIDAPPPGAIEHADAGDNDFLFGMEDPEALRCPFGAHIRRANPRDSFEPGSDEQIQITNRHRVLRVGRPYKAKAGQNPGLLFMCLNGDIERQFELLQQDWLRSPSFHGLSSEKDPVLGDAEEGVRGFTIPSREGPVGLKPMPRFVTTRGGGYFFLPGKRLIEYLKKPL